SKHNGITFKQAAEAFFDPFIKIVDASRNDEARDAIIGLDTRWNLLFVVHIEFEDDVIRIISARKATRKEREYYED
ncbi:BrnT family toxin, partial [Dolichospermum circinale CS-537/05]|nr:BrnT family toxin [Dolichospermum circinale CS-537/05]